MKMTATNVKCQTKHFNLNALPNIIQYSTLQNLADTCMTTTQSTEGLLWRLFMREKCSGNREDPHHPLPPPPPCFWRKWTASWFTQWKCSGWGRVPVWQWGACFGRGRPTAGGEGSVGWGLWSGTCRLAQRLQQMAAEQRGCGETRTVR